MLLSLKKIRIEFSKDLYEPQNEGAHVLGIGLTQNCAAHFAEEYFPRASKEWLSRYIHAIANLGI